MARKVVCRFQSGAKCTGVALYGSVWALSSTGDVLCYDHVAQCFSLHYPKRDRWHTARIVGACERLGAVL